MNVIHIADCHLDSAMETHLPAVTARARRKELLLTFSSILRAAVLEGAELLLIGGDLFDSPTPSANTKKYVLDQIKNHPELSVVLIEGNHDAGALAEDTLPQNLHLVKAGESLTLSFGEVDLFAMGYGVTEAALAALPINAERKSILLLHGTLGVTQDGEHPEVLPLSALVGRGIDYVALGHYHSFQATSLDSRTLACYAGVPEGRGFDEPGRGGYVSLSTETMRAHHVPIAIRTLHSLTLDITPYESQSEIENAVHGMIDTLSADDMVRLVLRGSFREKSGKDAGQIKALLEQRFYFARLKDESRLAIRAEDYKNDISLRGEFVRRVFAEEGLTEEERDRILSYGLRALCGEDPEEGLEIL